MAGIHYWWIHRAKGDPKEATVLKSWTEATKFVLDHREGTTVPEESAFWRFSDAEIERLSAEGKEIPKDPIPHKATVDSYPWASGNPVKRLWSGVDADGASFLRSAITIARQMTADNAISAAGDDAGIIERLVALMRCKEALAFARSVIKSGEPWTDTCEKVIEGALDACRRLT